MVATSEFHVCIGQHDLPLVHVPTWWRPAGYFVYLFDPKAPVYPDQMASCLTRTLLRVLPGATKSAMRSTLKASGLKQSALKAAELKDLAKHAQVEREIASRAL